MANNQIVISRIQNRRGIRENLPQPLLPGEFALTIDTGELWIGTDPNQPPFGVRTYGSGSGDISSAANIADNQIVSAKFTALDETGFDELVNYLTGSPTPAVVLTNEDILWDERTTVFIAADTSVDVANTINNIVAAVGNSPQGGAQIAQAFDALGAINDPTSAPNSFNVAGEFLLTISGSNAEQGAMAARLINSIHGSQLVTTLANLQVTTTGVGVGSSTFRDWEVFDDESGLPFTPVWDATGTASADSTTDKMHVVAGRNINIDVDVTNDALRFENTADTDPDTVYTGFITPSPNPENVATEATLAPTAAAPGGWTDVPNVIFEIDGDSDVIFMEYSLNTGANVPGSDNLTGVGNMRVVASNNADVQATIIDDQTLIKDSAYTGTIEFRAVHVPGTPSTSATELVFADNSPLRDTITYSAGASNFVADGFNNGDEIYVNGTTNNNGVYTIDTVTTTTITLIATESLTNETVSSATLSGRNHVKLQYVNTFSASALLRFVCRRWMSYDFASTPPPSSPMMAVSNLSGGDGGSTFPLYSFSTNATTWGDPSGTVTDGILANVGSRVALAYSPVHSRWVATGSPGDFAPIMTSDDNGATWVERTPDTLNGFLGVRWDTQLNQFIALGGGINTSPDGITWTNRSVNGTTVNMNDVCYNGTVWLATSGFATTAIKTSTDGITWGTTLSTPESFVNCCMAIGSRIFLAGTADVIRYSDNNGSTWTAATGSTSTGNIESMTHNGAGTIVAVTQSAEAVVSTDNGVSQTVYATGSTGALWSVMYDTTLNLFVAVGRNASFESLVTTSPDGITWTERANNTAGDADLNAIAGVNQINPFAG